VINRPASAGTAADGRKFWRCGRGGIGGGGRWPPDSADDDDDDDSG
jgi:hypothetical protein